MMTGVTTEPQPPAALVGTARRRLRAEIWVVLGLSLGASAVYAVISLVGKLTAGPPLAAQSATLNASQSPRPYLDLSYQVAGIVFDLMPVLLALWLLSQSGSLGSVSAQPAGSASGTVFAGGARRIGLDLRGRLRDGVHGFVLFAVIGLPGLGLYVVGRHLGITVSVVASGLNEYWWTVPVLVAQALKNALIEEVIVVGYLITRLRRLGWSTPAVFAASAVLRGSYHLYQGFGPFLGNAVMGLVFAEYFRRRGRVMPLVVAHTLLDVVAFVGYQFFARSLGLS